MFDRGGTPQQAIAACRLPDGRRAWAMSTDPEHRDRADRRRVGRPGGAHRQDRSASCLSSDPPVGRPRIIVDCDPGHDDAVAIVVAADTCDLVGITTVAGNAPLERTTHNALVVRELLGIDAPIHAGAARPLIADPISAADVHGASGLDGADLPEPTDRVDSHDAAAFIIDACRDQPGTWIVGVGPLTNVAPPFAVRPISSTRSPGSR